MFNYKTVIYLMCFWCLSFGGAGERGRGVQGSPFNYLSTLAIAAVVMLYMIQTEDKYKHT